MPPKPTTKNKLARQALLQFPNFSKRALAEYLNETYPALFTSAESARSMIKVITGSMGEVHRKYIVNQIKREPYKLPPSKCKTREFVKLPVSSNNILWLSDIHIPNQDNKALQLAIDYGVKNKINCVVLGGDILDNTPFTSHDAPPPGLDDVRTWFEYAQQFLGYLRQVFPKAHIVWIEGNHDNWIMRYLMKKAPILFNDEYYHLPQRLNLKSFNIEFYTQEKVLLAGKLQLHHGHTLIRGVFAPVNAARGLFLRAKSHALIGHVHTTSSHAEGNLKGEVVTTYSTGCLCTLAPDYDPHNTKHNVGFAHILTEKTGEFTVNNLKIINGKIY